MRSRKNLLTLLMAAVLSISIVSCGGSEEGGDAPAATTPSTNNTSNTTTLNGEGNVQYASSPSQFKTMVQNGQFAKTIFGNNFYNAGWGAEVTGVAFNIVTVTCYTEISQSDFLWWDDVFTSVSNDCNQTNTNRRIEYKSGSIQHEYGTTKQSILNQFMNIINNAESFQLVGNYGGGSSTIARARKSGKDYIFDLSKPILANPTMIQDANAYQSNGQLQEGDSEVIYFAGQQDIY